MTKNNVQNIVFFIKRALTIRRASLIFPFIAYKQKKYKYYV